MSFRQTNFQTLVNSNRLLSYERNQLKHTVDELQDKLDKLYKQYAADETEIKQLTEELEAANIQLQNYKSIATGYEALTDLLEFHSIVTKFISVPYAITATNVSPCWEDSKEPTITIPSITGYCVTSNSLADPPIGATYPPYINTLVENANNAVAFVFKLPRTYKIIDYEENPSSEAGKYAITTLIEVGPYISAKDTLPYRKADPEVNYGDYIKYELTPTDNISFKDNIAYIHDLEASGFFHPVGITLSNVVLRVSLNDTSSPNFLTISTENEEFQNIKLTPIITN